MSHHFTVVKHGNKFFYRVTIIYRHRFLTVTQTLKPIRICIGPRPNRLWYDLVYHSMRYRDCPKCCIKSLNKSLSSLQILGVIVDCIASSDCFFSKFYVDNIVKRPWFLTGFIQKVYYRKVATCCHQVSQKLKMRSRCFQNTFL